jgi:outer membrane protein insertion porin family
VFADAGSVWGLDNTSGFTTSVDDSRHINAASGLTLTAQFGNVPVTLFYAKPIKKQNDSVEENFGISLSAKF